MREDSKMALHTALSLDGSISREAIARALAILAGQPEREDDYVRVIKVRDAARILGVTPAGINAYVRRGLLTKVVDDREKTIGIRGDSLATFQRRRVVSKESLTN